MNIGYKMMPEAGPQVRKEHYIKHKIGVKWRRLSQTKMFNFSTNNRIDPEEEEKQRRMWYMSNFSNSFIGVTQNPLLLKETSTKK